MRAYYAYHFDRMKEEKRREKRNQQQQQHKYKTSDRIVHTMSHNIQRRRKKNVYMHDNTCFLCFVHAFIWLIAVVVVVVVLGYCMSHAMHLYVKTICNIVDCFGDR